MGPSFLDIHHYCWGIMKTNRALLLVRDQRMRTFYLGSAIGEFDYVIRRSAPGFKLLPEILTKKGENLIHLDRGPEGISQLESAIALKPDYWPPYAAMSDYYTKIGDLTKARARLEEGLSASPDAKPLKRRLAAIDGTKDNRATAPRPEKPSAPQ